MWRGGCIIRSAFLGKIKEAFDRDADLVNLLVDPYFAGEMNKAHSGWRRAVSTGALQGIPMPVVEEAGPGGRDGLADVVVLRVQL